MTPIILNFYQTQYKDICCEVGTAGSQVVGPQRLNRLPGNLLFWRFWMILKYEEVFRSYHVSIK